MEYPHIGKYRQYKTWLKPTQSPQWQC